jgi:hypothetical protein
MDLAVGAATGVGVGKYCLCDQFALHPRQLVRVGVSTSPGPAPGGSLVEARAEASDDRHTQAHVTEAMNRVEERTVYDFNAEDSSDLRCLQGIRCAQAPTVGI